MERFEEMMTEARGLRFDLPSLPGTDAHTAEIHVFLLDVRRRLDRVEQLLLLTTRARAAARRLQAAASADAENDWDEAITKVRTAPVRRHDEYSSARERAAEANLATLNGRRAVRHAVDALNRCDEALEFIRIIHRGLDGIRHDTLTHLRMNQYESNLERP